VSEATDDRRGRTICGLQVVLVLLAAAPASSQPTFNRDVAPIVFGHCLTCHHPGTNGAFSLLTYADVRPRAASIAAATRSRYMPPWKPERE
jgi:mono/diheme cytochrome c family protein